MPDVRRFAYVCADQREADRLGTWARAIRVTLLVPGQQTTGHRYDVITVGRKFQARAAADDGLERPGLHLWLDTMVRPRLVVGGDMRDEPERVACAS